MTTETSDVYYTAGADHGTHETFAQYFAKLQVAKKAFRPSEVPELEPLRTACDYVLTLSDGLVFSVMCIVDREADPDRRFDIHPRDLNEIGEQCRKYCGRINFSRAPLVFFELIEIGPGPFTDDDRKRLRSYNRMWGAPKISACTIDTTAKTIWSSAPFKGYFRQRQLQPIVDGPREQLTLVQPADVIGPVPGGFPLLTYGLLAAIVAAFTCEHAFALDPAVKLLEPSLRTLLALGASSRSLVESGEWYRLFTAPFLHGDLTHLALNGIVLFVIGRPLERAIGHAWFAGVYFVSAWLGAAFSLWFNAPQILSVGASGAIMGLLAAALVISFRFPNGQVAAKLRITALQVLIPSLLPLSGAATGHTVDYAAHFGGAIGGAAMGGGLFLAWPASIPGPRLKLLAATLGALGLAAALVGASFVAKDYETYALMRQLIPDNDLPRTQAAIDQRSAELREKYPRDPRARWYRAIALSNSNAFAAAERELRAGLEERQVLKKLLPRIVESGMRATLVLVVAAQGRQTEAVDIAQPICADGGGGMIEELRKREFCR
jgi:rhomboid protease GluP